MMGRISRTSYMPMMLCLLENGRGLISRIYIESFHLTSGLKVNLSKCSVYGIGVRGQDIQNLAFFFKLQTRFVSFQTIRLTCRGQCEPYAKLEAGSRHFQKDGSLFGRRNTCLIGVE
ncbi:hypothetical protein HanHA300_Chr17g0673931 [Helianthus annuus]|nr:hypothetical protein HanHA300_Chr17g0673931 [Helianthus annuus]KAJ0449317.1 hypothetical protein HanHA89_Chr17g0727091 [Helianthus annuus]KAJ0634167.1 hypothetical protein HanLR1_Chr17g0685121 [Helianthus annuus]